MLLKMNNVVTALILILVLSFMGTLPPAASTSSPVAKPGCQSRCGKVTIPYPFGIGSADCFYNEWYQIICKDERPYIHINQDGVEPNEVLHIGVFHVRMITIRSSTPNMRLCEDTSQLLGANLTGTPFSYSSGGYNKFMLVGCGTATFFSSSSEETPKRKGCTSNCDSRNGLIDGCYGINCCQYDSGYSGESVREYKMEFSKSLSGKNSCASVFMVDRDWYPKNGDSYVDIFNVSVPLLLEWKITPPMPEIENNKYCHGYGTSNNEWFCYCPCGYSGNPYIHDGCRDRQRYCSGPFLLRNLKSIIVGGTSLLISILAATSYLLYKTIRRRIQRKKKQKMFKQNGGLLLQKYLSSNKNIMEKVRLFTSKDVNTATDQFNENRILGRGGQGTVYKGMLQDGKIVAIKKSKLLFDENQVEGFINEIIILSQIDHRNVVKLYGCCLEMDVPLLVYEFIPNGTLYNLIHSENTIFPLSWEVRLRISLEVAEALAYLHSSTSIPVYHRDVKSSNILLDEKYRVKVADFGTSRNIGIDQTHITTLVKGTFGYLDPEYFQSSQFTEKSDVYSFGVVLVELLTGLKPICFSEEEQSHLNLAGRFLLAMEDNCVDEILDPQVKETCNEEELKVVIRLSQRCLYVNGRNRPTMKEIVMELQSIKKSILSSVLVNSYENGDIAEKEIELLGISTSIHLTTSSSDASPLMSSSF